MNAIEQFEHNGKRVSIYQDEDAQSPREWDQLGEMVHWHRNYNLGDREATETELRALRSGGFPVLRRYLRRFYGVSHLIPMGLLDHSGLHVYADGGAHWTDSQGWDSGTVGFIMATPKTIEMCGTPDELIDEGLRAEIEEFDQFLRGDVYGYVVEEEIKASGTDSAGTEHEYSEYEHVDSCSGFFGFEYCKQAAIEAADSD